MKCQCCGKVAELHPAFTSSETGEVILECEECDPPDPPLATNG